MTKFLDHFSPGGLRYIFVEYLYQIFEQQDPMTRSKIQNPAILPQDFNKSSKHSFCVLPWMHRFVNLGEHSLYLMNELKRVTGIFDQLRGESRVEAVRHPVRTSTHWIIFIIYIIYSIIYNNILMYNLSYLRVSHSSQKRTSK